MFAKVSSHVRNLEIEVNSSSGKPIPINSPIVILFFLYGQFYILVTQTFELIQIL